MEMNRKNDEMKKCVTKEINRNNFNEYDHSNMTSTSSNNNNNTPANSNNNSNNNSSNTNIYERKGIELQSGLEKQVEFLKSVKNDQKNYKKKYSIWNNKNSSSSSIYSQSELNKNSNKYKTSDVEDCVVSTNNHTKLHLSNNSVSTITTTGNNNNSIQNSAQCCKDNRSNLSSVEEHLNTSSKNAKNENEGSTVHLFNSTKVLHDTIIPCSNEKKMNMNQNYTYKRNSSNNNSNNTSNNNNNSGNNNNGYKSNNSNSNNNNGYKSNNSNSNNNSSSEKVVNNSTSGNQNNDVTKLKGLNSTENVNTTSVDKKYTSTTYSFKETKNKKTVNSGTNDGNVINQTKEASGKIENESSNMIVSINRDRTTIFGETNSGRVIGMNPALIDSSHMEGTITKSLVDESNCTSSLLGGHTNAFSENSKKHKGGVERREGSRRKEKTPYSIPTDKYLNAPTVSHFSNENRMTFMERERNSTGVLPQEESTNKKKKSYREIIKRACGTNDQLDTIHNISLLNNQAVKNVGSNAINRSRKTKNQNNFGNVHSSKESKSNVKVDTHQGSKRDMLLMKPNVPVESEETSLSYGKSNEPKNSELIHMKLTPNMNVVGKGTNHNKINDSIFKETTLGENDVSLNEKLSFLNIDSSLNTWKFKPLAREESQKRESKANSFCSSNESIFDEIRKFSNRGMNFQDSFYDFSNEDYRNSDNFNNVLHVEETNRCDNSRVDMNLFNVNVKDERENLRFDVNELLKGEKDIMSEINRMSGVKTKNACGTSGCEIPQTAGTSFEGSNSKNHLNGLPTVTNITHVHSLQSMNSFNSLQNLNRMSSGSNESNIMRSKRGCRISKNDSDYIKYKGEQTREFLSNPNFLYKNVFQDGSQFENTNQSYTDDPWVNSSELSFMKANQMDIRSSCNVHKTNNVIPITRNRTYKEHMIERNKLNMTQDHTGDVMDQPRKNLFRNNVHPYHSKGNQNVYGSSSGGGGLGRRRNCQNTNDLLSKDMNIDPLFFTNMKYDIFPYDNEVIPTDTQTNEYFLGVTTDSLLNHPYKESDKSSSECGTESIKKKDHTKEEGMNISMINESAYTKKHNHIHEGCDIEKNTTTTNNNTNNLTNVSNRNQKETSDMIRNDTSPWFDTTKNRNRSRLFESEADTPQDFTGLPITHSMQNLMEQLPIIKCVNNKELTNMEKGKARKNGLLVGKDAPTNHSLSVSEHRYYDLFGNANNTNSEEELLPMEAKSPLYNQTNEDKIYPLSNEANIWNIKMTNRVETNGVKSGHAIRENPVHMEKTSPERRANCSMNLKNLLDNRDSVGKLSSGSTQIFKANDEAYIQKHLRNSISYNKANCSMEGEKSNNVSKEIPHGRNSKEASSNRNALNYSLDISANHDKINEMQNIINDLQTQNQKLERELDYVKRMYLKKKQSQILNSLSNNREVLSTYSSYKEDSCDSDGGSVGQSKKYMQQFLEEQKRYDGKVPIQKFQLAYTSNSVGKLKIAAQRDISGSFMGPKGIHVKTIKSSLHISVYKSAKDVWFPGFADSHVFLLKGNIFGILRACQLLYHYVKSKMSYSKCCIYLVAPFECVQKLLADGCKRMATIKEECGADVRLGNLYVQVNEGFTERLMEIRGNECSVDSALEKLVIFMQSCFSVQSCDYELLKYPCRSVLNLP